MNSSLAAATRGPRFDAAGIAEAIRLFRQPVHVVRDAAQGTPRLGLALDGELAPGQAVIASLPASYPEYLDWSSLDLFDGIGAYWRPSANLTGDGEPERIDVCRLTPGLLSLLGIEPFLGRGLLPEDDQPGAERVALLSHRLWERRFGSDGGILGRSIRVDGEPFTVIGVLPQGAEGLTPSGVMPASTM